MATDLQVPYYAGADLIYLPYATSDLAIRYVAKRKPAFVVLSSWATTQLPYISQWYASGIPDSRATLVFVEGTPPGEQIKVYRWADSVTPAAVR
jgi:hypothetical protein